MKVIVFGLWKISPATYIDEFSILRNIAYIDAFRNGSIIDKGDAVFIWFA